MLLNTFYASGLFLYPLEKVENLWFSDVTRVHRQGRVVGIFLEVQQSDVRKSMDHSMNLFKVNNGNSRVTCEICL